MTNSDAGDTAGAIPTADHNTTIMPTASDAAETTKRKRRSQKPQHTAGEPVVRYGTHDGKPAAFITLFGTRGHGKEAIVDADRLPEIAEKWGLKWVLNSNGSGRDYVSSARDSVGRFAGQKRGAPPLARLARLLSGAGKGEVAVCLDDNTLNLMGHNIAVMTQAEHTAWRRNGVRR